MNQNHGFISTSILAIKQAAKKEPEVYTDSDWNKVTKAFHIFSETLVQHIENEDTVFYERAEVCAGENSLFYRLLSDHIEIRELVDKCNDGIRDNNRSRFAMLIDQLESLIEEHTIREEKIMSEDSEQFESSTARVITLLRNLHVE